MKRHPTSRRPEQKQRPARLTKATLGALALLAALITAPLLAALSATPAQPAPATPVVIHIGATLDPAAVTVPPGTVVTWHNHDAGRHRMRTHGGPAEFDTGNLGTGESYSVVLEREGTYSYMDHRSEHRGHAAYSGTIVVQAGVPPSAPPASTPPPATPPPTPPAPSTASVSIANSAFGPAAVTVAVGGTVTWTNNDTRPHTVTAADAGFDSGILARGATYQRTFPTAGTFSYLCVVHPEMTGTVTVVAAGDAPPPPTPPPPAPPPPATPPPATTPPPAGNPSNASVSIANNAFGPATVTIAVGGTVTWTNNDTRVHTVTVADRSFDSGILARGATYQRTFPAAGTFNYVCDLHPEMTATILVTDGSAPPPPAAAPPPPPAAPAVTPPPVQTTTTAGTPPRTASVSIAGNAFGPRSVKVAVGGTVTWTNNDTKPHTVTAADNSFDSGIMARGATFKRTFTAAGTYEYICAVHPDMTATVVVTNGATAPPAKKTATKPAAAKTATPSTAPATPGSAAAASASVSMRGSAFGPRTATIRPGGTVSWRNDDTVPHTVTANDGSFDSGIVKAGGRYQRTYPAAGTFAYKCIFHPGMTGTVVVRAADGTAPPAARTAANVATATQVGSTASTAAAPAPGTRTAKVEMRDVTFAPAGVTVPVGSTVVFVNVGKLPHTVTARDKSFDSGLVAPGAKWSRTFTKTGTFAYDCIIHPGMTGTVTVIAAAAAAGGVGGPTGGASEGAAAAASQAGVSSVNTTGIALLVGGLTIAGGALYLLGMLLVELSRLRAAIARPVVAVARAARFAVLVVWRFTVTRVVHPFHPGALGVRFRVP